MMNLALEMAFRSFAQDEVPVGAIIFDDQLNRVIASTGNEMRKRHDPTAHAEMLAIQEASKKLETERLVTTTLYVTLEPCPMCAQAISYARIPRLIFGAEDPKYGGVIHGPKIFESSSCHSKPKIIGGVRAKESQVLLKTFFKDKRA